MANNQPYIPIYIGDWEKDTNCITPLAEFALLKLCFKLFNAEKRGVFYANYRTLSVLFKSNLDDTKDIFQELIDNKILNIKLLEDGKFEIISRRMIREGNISEIRAIVGAKGGKANGKQNKSKIKAKSEQNTDIDNDINNNKEIGNEPREDSNGKFSPPTLEQVKNYFAEKYYAEHRAEAMYEYYTGRNWINKDDKPVVNWKLTACSVWFKDEYKIEKPSDAEIQKEKHIQKLNKLYLKNGKYSYMGVESSDLDSFRRDLYMKNVDLYVNTK